MEHKTSYLYVEAHEAEKTGLVDKLGVLGVQAQKMNGMGVDVGWTIDGQWVLYDNKTPEDLVKSAVDGRLHEQIAFMRDTRKAVLWGFIIEGPLNTLKVGHEYHSWELERLDNLLLTMQVEGATVVHSLGQHHTPMRLASLYKWTQKESHGSLHAPVRPSFTLNQEYVDETERKLVQTLMAIFPRMGEKRAREMLRKYTVQEILGITDEGLLQAGQRWLTVDGIGAGLAGNWMKVLREDYTVALRK